MSMGLCPTPASRAREPRYNVTADKNKSAMFKLYRIAFVPDENHTG